MPSLTPRLRSNFRPFSLCSTIFNSYTVGKFGERGSCVRLLHNFLRQHIAINQDTISEEVLMILLLSYTQCAPVKNYLVWVQRVINTHGSMYSITCPHLQFPLHIKKDPHIEQTNHKSQSSQL